MKNYFVVYVFAAILAPMYFGACSKSGDSSLNGTAWLRVDEYGSHSLTFFENTVVSTGHSGTAEYKYETSSKEVTFFNQQGDFGRDREEDLHYKSAKISGRIMLVWDGLDNLDFLKVD